MWWPCSATGSCPTSAAASRSTWRGGWRRSRPARARRSRRAARRAARWSGTGGAAAGAGRAAGPGQGSAGAERAARKELQRLERQIDRLGQQEAELAGLLAAQASDYQKLIELGAQLRGVQEEKAKLEEQWLTVAEELPG